MSEKGIFSLAEIARFLQTSPQAVSNWKSRDQVPHHIAAKIIVKNEDFSENPNKQYAIKPDIENNEFIGFTDILLKLAEIDLIKRKTGKYPTILLDDGPPRQQDL